MMDIKSIADEIEKKIRELETGRMIIRDRAEQKANAIACYDRALAIKIITLKNEKLPLSIVDKVARGECWKEKLEMEKAEGMYRAATSGIDSLCAELNGWQSIFRHLSHV